MNILVVKKVKLVTSTTFIFTRGKQLLACTSVTEVHQQIRSDLNYQQSTLST